ncbi:MAG: cystathionine gamma-synthase family protein [Lewinella sp.]|nr:cystathionine gamma-synthase family protein [Lewinella sp.]
MLPPRDFHPESMMMSYGYHPEWSEGSIKCPIFQTSTFVFRSAEEGKAFFELAYGLREPENGEAPGLIYSRINHPDLEILENRLTLWDKSEDAAVFNSGMAAITTALMAFLQPGDLLLFTRPLYGGTHHYITEVLTRFGIEVRGIAPWATYEEMYDLLSPEDRQRLAVIFVETPGNPTNALVDISECRRLADACGRPDRRPLVMVDNTFMGPVWQHPLQHGADLVLYSATKYIGGHSDLIAGACLGSKDLIRQVKELRGFLGNMADAWTGWLLMRSLETLPLRMEKQARNTAKVAEFLRDHPKVHDVHYLGFLEAHHGRAYDIYRRQCTAGGAMLSFLIGESEAEAFAFLNELKMVKLAVSLGSTESLIQHPATMTHAGVPAAEKLEIGITDNLVRLSVGVEHPDDLIWDLGQALAAVPAPVMAE